MGHGAVAGRSRAALARTKSTTSDAGGDRMVEDVVGQGAAVKRRGTWGIKRWREAAWERRRIGGVRRTGRMNKTETGKRLYACDLTAARPCR